MFNWHHERANSGSYRSGCHEKSDSTDHRPHSEPCNITEPAGHAATEESGEQQWWTSLLGTEPEIMLWSASGRWSTCGPPNLRHCGTSAGKQNIVGYLSVLIQVCGTHRGICDEANHSWKRDDHTWHKVPAGAYKRGLAGTEHCKRPAILVYPRPSRTICRCPTLPDPFAQHRATFSSGRTSDRQDVGCQTVAHAGYALHAFTQHAQATPWGAMSAGCGCHGLDAVSVAPEHQLWSVVRPRQYAG